MIKQLYVVRHCEAEGQQPEATLTTRGRLQAEALADFLTDKGIQRIVSSPFVRACQSIEPFAQRIGLKVETDERLSEFVLGAADLPDWECRLRETFENSGLSFEGGESSRAATSRAVSAIYDVLKHNVSITAVVSHGKLMTLLLKHFDDRFDFDDWQLLTNPDIFHIIVTENETLIKRLWK